MELHLCLLCDGPPGELGGRPLVDQYTEATTVKVTLSYCIRRINTVFFVEELKIWEAVDRDKTIAVHDQ